MPRLFDHLRASGLSNKEIHALLETGKVFYDDVPTADGGRDVDVTRLAIKRSATRLKPNVDLAIIHRDPHLVVVYKPPGMLAVDAAGRPGDRSVVATVARLFGAAYPVHRLDEPTSGLMMVALTEVCQRRIKEILFEHRIERRYLAIVAGAFPDAACTVDSTLVRNRGDGLRGTAWEEGDADGRQAITHLRLVERLGPSASLVEARLETGRTHQVRIHLTEKGYPVLGDPLYAPAGVTRAAPRLALHAYALGLRQPLTGAALSFKAPLADDLERLRRRLLHHEKEHADLRRPAPRARARPAPLAAGIYLVHKEPGPTSRAVLQALTTTAAKGKLAVCHGGALDPFAEGLLLLLCGPATRLMDLLHTVPKTYEAEICWGKETDNGDLFGRVLREGDAAALTPRRLEEVLAGFLGWQQQIPPAHSNKRIDGERADAKAHRGEPVALPPSRVYLHEARFVSHALPHASTLRLVSRGGYYVRALARDLGRALDCGAHLTALCRTAIGPWQDVRPGERLYLQGEALLPWCASRIITARELKGLAGKKALPRGRLLAPTWRLPEGFPDPRAPVRGLCDGRLVAMLREDGDSLVPQILLGSGV
ncbi:MAG: hypothetical protein HY903_02095 [Deltaproteobacteria bacterium]|nr:hypothetical protein [Deltaproteobacteria bacterium]